VSTLELRPYQRACVDAVHAAAERGIRRPLVAMSTGCGKSLAAAYLVREREGRAVILAHRDELLRQLGRSLEHAGIERGRIGYVKADEDQVNHDFVIASVQTLARPNRLARLIESQSPGARLWEGDKARPFVTVIADEAHHHLGGESENTFGAVLRGLGAYDDAGPLTVGWTATPERGDGGALASVWQEIVFEMGIMDGIAQGYLCDVRAKQVQLAADFNKLHTRGGDFRDEETAEMLMAASAPAHVVKAYKEHAPGRKALVFTPTVAVAEAMSEAFRAAGIPAETAHGGLSDEERAGVLRRLRTGETMVVPNAQLLTEGFDEPSVDCVVMARPTKSRPFAIQMIGRGTRIFPGKTDCVVLDVVGSVSRMDLVTVAELFGVDAKAAEGGVLKAVKAKRAADAARVAVAAEMPPAQDGRLVSVDVAMFSERAFQWVAAGMKFVLSLGDRGSLTLRPGAEADEWEIAQKWRETLPGSKWPRDMERKLYAGLSLEEAQGRAEDIVRKSGAARLNSKDANWRKDAPTDKQISILTRRGKYRAGMSKGEASDALTALFTR
jgi:ATP-dependent helicase IRC3